MSTPSTMPADSASRRSPIARAVRAAVRELFDLREPAPAPAPAPARAIAVGRSAYRGAEVTKYNLDWRTMNDAPDNEIGTAMMTLRSRARDLARNNPYIKRYRSLLGANIIGSSGITHQAQVRFVNPDGTQGDLNEPLNDYLEQKFREYRLSRVSADGKFNLDRFQVLQLGTCAVDGETLTRTIFGREFPHGLGLQPIDADLLAETYNLRAGPGDTEVRLGVEVNSWGRPLAYHFWEYPDYLPGRRARGGLRRLTAAEILHHYVSDRAGQTRGVTWLSNMMQDTQDLAGYDESVIVGARAGANQLAVAQWRDPTMAPPVTPPEGGETEARKPLQMDMVPATITELDPGLELASFDPKQPSGVYADFTKTVIRRIANGLDLSYSSLSNDLREVNYSSAKIGLLMEREIWKMIQEWWIDSFTLPLYLRWLEAATLSGALQLPTPDWRAYSAVNFQARRWPWAEPQREIGATKDMISLGLTSRQRVLAEQSDSDVRKVLDELAQEEKMASERKLSIAGDGAGAQPAPANPKRDAADEDPDPAAADDDEPDEPDDDDAEDDEPAKPRKQTARSSRVAALERRPAANGHGR